jgi:hypothetical protein
MDKELLMRKLEEIKKSIPKGVSYPSTAQMIKNAAQSVVKNVQSVIEGNSLSVSSEEANLRLNVCKTCPYFDKDQERCKQCGCKMAVKTYLKAEKCPIGKW